MSRVIRESKFRKNVLKSSARFYIFYMATFTRTRSHGMSIDIKNFSYGGVTPLFTTFESEANAAFDLQSNESSSEELDSANGVFSDNDSQNESDDEKKDDDNPILPKPKPAPINIMTKTKTHNDIENMPKKNPHHNHTQSLIMRPRASSLKTKKKKGGRSRANTMKAVVSNESFHHFRIRSITISPNTNHHNDHDDDEINLNEDNDHNLYDDESKTNTNHNHPKNLKPLHTRIMSPISMKTLNEDEEHDSNTPIPSMSSPTITDFSTVHHQSNNTMIINNDLGPLSPISPTSPSVTITSNSNGFKYKIIPKKKTKHRRKRRS